MIGNRLGAEALSSWRNIGGEHGSWLALVANRDSNPDYPDCLAFGRPARLKSPGVETVSQLLLIEISIREVAC